MRGPAPCSLHHRTLTTYRNPGRWFGTTGEYVGHESWQERDRRMGLDANPEVVGWLRSRCGCTGPGIGPDSAACPGLFRLSCGG